MPQLMPLFWYFSVMMVLFLVFVLVWFYSLKEVEYFMDCENLNDKIVYKVEW